jgi:hypothetical protein
LAANSRTTELRGHINQSNILGEGHPMNTSAKRHSIARFVLVLPAAVIAGLILAATHTASAEQEGQSASQSARYLPSIADLMIATIQPRHRRLWQAATAKNWAFAAYELGNLRGAFNRIGLAHPATNNISFPEMITSVTKQPFDELDAAIKSKDETGFTKAYADFTDGCNSCHQALNHSVIVIRVPTGASGADLDLSPTRP